MVSDSGEDLNHNDFVDDSFFINHLSLLGDSKLTPVK